MSRASPLLGSMVRRLSNRGIVGSIARRKATIVATLVLGAAGGAVINTLFISHFQSVARGHFTIRRLERIYGQPAVRALYDRLSL